jgi:hypothetical protein
VSDSGNPPEWAYAAFDLLQWAGYRCDNRDEYRVQARPSAVVETLRVRYLDSLYYLARNENPAAQRLYDKLWRNLRRNLIEVVSGLTRDRIAAVVFKGAEVFERWFGSRAIGILMDADLLVPRDQLIDAKRVLLALGYRPGVFDLDTRRLVDRDVRDIAEIEMRHYELAPFCRIEPLALDAEEMAVAAARGRDPVWVIGGEAVHVIEIDVHHAVAADIESGPLFDRAVQSALGVGNTLSEEDHFWLIASKFYTEVALHGKKSLRDLAYLALMLGTPMRWELMMSQIENYEIRPAVYYHLHFLNRLLDGPVPVQVLERLQPTRGSRLRDWGWQLGKLFDFVEREPIDRSRA